VAELTSIRLDPPPFDPSTITAPVLVVCGGDSDERHHRATEWLANQLPAGSLHEIEGAGHGGHQSHPAELARLILGAVAVAVDPTAERPHSLV
jgi:pimeloyl-ACP methyl ester carboxylesterase